MSFPSSFHTFYLEGEVFGSRADENRFGVTELAKGDEEHGTAEHIEKGPNTQVQESTADAARANATTTTPVNQKEVQI